MSLFFGNSHVKIALGNLKFNPQFYSGEYVPNLDGIMLRTMDESIVRDANGDYLSLELNTLLPDEYQEVSWIRAEANAESYIDLGFAFDTAAKIYMTLYISDKGSNTYPFGAVENDGALRCCLHCPYYEDGGAQPMARLYGSRSETSFTATVLYVNEGKASLALTLESGKLHIEDITNETSSNIVLQSVYTMESNLYLFAQNYNGAPRFGGARQIGRFQYYDKNDELICDLVPCYRKSDAKIGMYDLARNIFLTNAGTGSFRMINDEE